MGSAHAVCIRDRRIKGLTLGAVCDSDPAKRLWAEQNLPGIPCYEDFRALIQSGRVDAIVIAAPHYLHPEIAVSGFHKGLSVLTEKPAGVYVNQVIEMNKAAAAAGTVFGIMFNQRTNPLFARARELVRDGSLGVPKRLIWIVTNWYRTQQYYNSGGWRGSWAGEGGGVLMNQAPHNLDLWQWIFGMPASLRAFCGYGRYHDVEIEDDVTIYAEYPNGASASFITTTGEDPGTNRLEISGDGGKMVIGDGRLRFWKLGISERQYCFDPDGTPGKQSVTVEELAQTEPEPAHAGILQNFTNAILYGEPLLAPGIEGIHSLQIANAAYLSDWTGETVTLPADPDRFEAMLREKAEKSAKKQAVSGEGAAQGVYHHKWNTKW